MKSKPLTDITNTFNLIPFSTLQELCNSTKTSIKKSPIPKNSKPYNALSTAALKQGLENKLASDNRSSKSNTSIGSSDPTQNAVEFTTPLRRFAPPPTPPLGSGGSGILYTRRQTKVEAKRGKELSELEKTKEKTKAITRSTSRPVHVEKAVEKGNGISVPSVRIGSSSVEKIKDKGKATDVTYSSTITLKNIKDKGKAIATPSDDLSETSNKGKADLIPLNCLPPLKTEAKRKKEPAVSSCSSLPRPKRTRKRMNEAGETESPKAWTTDPYPKRRCKRQRQGNKSEFSLPPEFVEQQKAYWKQVDEFELSVEEISADELDI